MYYVIDAGNQYSTRSARRRLSLEDHAAAASAPGTTSTRADKQKQITMLKYLKTQSHTREAAKKRQRPMETHGARSVRQRVESDERVERGAGTSRESKSVCKFRNVTGVQ